VTTTTTTPAAKATGRKLKLRPRTIMILAGALVLVIAATVIFVITSGGVPYSDNASVGDLALYDKAGNPVTSGSINDRPFVAYAVSLVKAPKPYDKDGRKAALLAFSPQKNSDPSQWPSDFMTGSTPYSDPNHPTATAVSDDISIANFLAEFPSQWDGYIQLRMYLGAPGEPGMTTSYTTADIRVNGNTWTLVRGATSAPGGVPKAAS
jgi:hypothetical protein